MTETFIGGQHRCFVKRHNLGIALDIALSENGSRQFVMLIMFYRIHIMHRDVERFCNFPLRQVLLHPGSTSIWLGEGGLISSAAPPASDSSGAVSDDTSVGIGHSLL